jgi:hypothetical protein
MTRTKFEILQLKFMLRKMNYCTFSTEEKKLFKDVINDIQHEETN